MQRAVKIFFALLCGCSGQLVGNGSTVQPIQPRPIDGPPPMTKAECDGIARTASHVTVRRLNRFEYNSTIRDLIGETNNPAAGFPTDDFGGNFDNQGEVLSTAPVLVEKYAAAAEKLAQTLVAKEQGAGFSRQVNGSALKGTVGEASGNSYNLFSNGTASTTLTGMPASRFTFTVKARETAAGAERAQMRLLVDSKVVLTASVESTAKDYPTTVDLSAGDHVFAAEFTNDFYDMTTMADRNLLLESFAVSAGGSGAAGPNNKLIVCDLKTGTACVDSILKGFGRKAFRRPLNDEELTQYRSVFTTGSDGGAGATAGLSLAVEAMLLSPSFLFRVEQNGSGGPRALDDFELATRLSYFIWGSMPDAELNQLADSGTLKSQLAAQATRMAKDPKATALVTQFAGSWLWSRTVDDVKPDTMLFPMMTPELKSSMRQETEAFVATFLSADRDVTEMLVSDDVYLNDALAKHYGLPAVGSTALQRVSPAPANRGGLLSQAGLLSVTSHPTKTSPVRRGKWVLAQLLCQEPPPPPPNVPSLEDKVVPTGTLREQLEEHRKNPACAGCHKSMDPIGFGMENFDPVGRWRTEDKGGFPIDASAMLGGQAFSGPRELGAVLKKETAFQHCMSKQLLSYAVGRAVNDNDACTVIDLDEQLKQKNHFSDLMLGVVSSQAFINQLGE